MKESLKRIIDQFESYPECVRHFVTDVLLIEDEKLDVEHPQVVSPIARKLDKLVDVEFEKEK